MRVSTKGRYGLRAMVDLAEHEEGKAIPIREISERQNISEQYLEQLFATLRKAKLVKSVRGAHGGYMLNHEPEDISVADILIADVINEVIENMSLADLRDKAVAEKQREKMADKEKIEAG
jgi:Rrf2 family protein